MLNKKVRLLVFVFCCTALIGCTTTTSSGEQDDTPLVQEEAIQKANDVKRKSDLEQVKAVLVRYQADTGSLPATSYSGLVAYLVPDYLRALPQDPNGAGEYSYQTTGSEFVLRVTLEYTGEVFEVSGL